MGHRESVQNKNFIRKLPLNDETDYKQIQTETSCSKQEEKRVNTLRELFDLVIFFYKTLLPTLNWKKLLNFGRVPVNIQ